MMIYVYFKAPFGAFRSFRSVEMSPTAEFITHSAAYGFLLGLAGVDRHRKNDFIDASIAIGIKTLRLPTIGRTYQQLIQGERVLNDKEGWYFNPRPFWREVLIGIEGYVGLSHPELESLVCKGINEPSLLSYWGIPFLGDNNFFAERIDTCEQPEPCLWLCPLMDNHAPNSGRLLYLSVWTDYKDSTRSKSLLFYQEKADSEPPKEAWVTVQPSN